MIRKVIIEVSGGVAECTACPVDVEVIIIDHDNEADPAPITSKPGWDGRYADARGKSFALDEADHDT